ncbi:hypothetical protein [Actinomadura madurae]|nr:hypothetical protein [Actinomadura madurae]MCP9984856.1 hypothetical protein [Actinomadura madurae]
MSMFATPAVDHHRDPDGLLLLRSRIPAGTPGADRPALAAPVRRRDA